MVFSPSNDEEGVFSCENIRIIRNDMLGHSHFMATEKADGSSSDMLRRGIFTKRPKVPLATKLREFFEDLILNTYSLPPLNFLPSSAIFSTLESA